MSTNLTILVADDDADIRTLISDALRTEGHTVLVAENGDQAVRQLSSVQIDLAILDVNMPGKTGNEVCYHLRSLPLGDLVPVMLVTARDSIDDKVEGLQGGADDYLTKPFQMRELLARVKSLLRVRSLNLSLYENSEQLKALQAELVKKRDL